MSLQTGTRDMLIELIKSELYHGFALGLPKTYASTMRRIEQMIDDHRKVQDDTTVTSKLKERVPTVGKFHTSLPLEEAWGRYDQKYCVSSRRNVPPSFNEVRHTMNLAQVMKLPDLELACFDGDGTLYTDQRNFSYMPLAQVLIMLMQNGVTVVLVTAAGYGYDGPKYEVRLRLLLDAFIAESLSEETLRRFMVLGGECNYLLRCNAEARLVQVPDEEWQAPALEGPTPRFWRVEECERLLDIAEASLRESIKDLKLRAKVIRKARGVGIISGGAESVAAMPVGHGQEKLKSEALTEVVYRAKESLANAEPPVKLPYCAFNGGGDAWVDVGNKCIGMQTLQAFLKVPRGKCVHVGDQFLKTGNDVAARDIAPCLWIESPKETLKVLEILLGVMGLERRATSSDGHDIFTGETGKTVTSPGPTRAMTVPELAMPTGVQHAES